MTEVTGEQYVQVSTTTDSADRAAELVSSAVAARVAACGQVVGPITSTYWWQGAQETAEEWLILFKTPADRAAALQQHILAGHGYDVPEIIHTPIIGGNPAYLAWLTAETRFAQG
ncbi:periplasmic divalent cation tolerance protein [Allocatelliglobosispora scoriae]|uniref:Periplasmic divalent cation tolerance protein n=1 Tax=Allocatelliglobosispora scoriae TaxID=643052 RepID=A0A841C3S3_9ACTN|nr:divalent-cation tolerance protein CutA [Allocatelliglobosispora scoriae]MBB5874576.1 periplasmic divalent cation tolerance protein [Allocatelliglobosispora scoriae]